MDIYEALVESLLTRNDKGMVCPQFELRDEAWTANFDFLAYDFVSENLALVEVSSAENPSGLITKAKRFAEDRNRLYKQLSGSIFPDARRARFLGFVWNAPQAYTQCKNVDAESDICFIRIEDVVRAGAYWEGRGKGLPVRDIEGRLRFPTNDRS